MNTYQHNKKSITILLLMASLLVLGICGCGKRDVSGNTNETTTVEMKDPASTISPEAGKTEPLPDSSLAIETPANSDDATDSEKSETPEASVGNDKSESQDSSADSNTSEKPKESKDSDVSAEAEATVSDLSVPNSGAHPSTTGSLSVTGSHLTDSSGNTVQLRGVSTHGLAWFPDYVNQNAFHSLRYDWNCNVVRLAMYTAEYGGYCSGGDQSNLKQLVKNGVEYATAEDLYVIIDWHILSDNNPNTNKESAKSFFKEMASTYADYNNVLYEICNEPNGGTSWNDIKSYALEIIPIIREYDSDAVILVGTPTWSQEVDKAAADPITEYDNICYTLHFYAATHKDSLRSTLSTAADKGLPIFVSEYGICDASGNGSIDTKEADKWVELLDSYGISYVAWNLSNKNESSSLLSSSCSKTSSWSTSDLSASGKWLMGVLGGSGYTGSGSASTNQESNGSTNSNENNAGGGNTKPNENNTDPNTGTGNIPATDNTPLEPPAIIDSSANISYTISLTNQWGEGDSTYYQYDITILNMGNADVNSWNVVIPFSAVLACDQGWCANFSAEGNSLTLSNVDYNGSIPAGGSVSGIGCILIGPSDFKPQ